MSAQGRAKRRSRAASPWVPRSQTFVALKGQNVGRTSAEFRVGDNNRVNMILDAANRERWTFSLLEYACLIGEQRISDVIRQPQLAMFHAENQMDQVLDQRLWQRLACSRM